MSGFTIAVVSTSLIAAGVYGVLTSRNVIRMLASVETVFNGVILAVLLMALDAARLTPAPQVAATVNASLLVLFAVILTGVEVAVLAAIILLVFRAKQSVAVEDVSKLRG